MRLTIAVPLVAVAALLAGCGDDTGDGTAAEPTASPTSASPSVEPVSAQKSCAELYRPPGQLLPRAIELVHGSPSAEDTARADDLVSGLTTAEGHALEALATDIAVAREGVEATIAGEQPAVGDFDKAVNRLARHCELYND
jgi:hypothetical protein